MSRIGENIKAFRWYQWLIVACFLLASFLTGFTIYRVVHHARSWRHHHDEPIRGWMTVGYVAHTYHVPAQALYRALGLEGDRFDRRTLREIAEDQHRSMEDVRRVLEGAIIQAGSPYLSPSPSPTPSATRAPARRPEHGAQR